MNYPAAMTRGTIAAAISVLAALISTPANASAHDPTPGVVGGNEYSQVRQFMQEGYVEDQLDHVGHTTAHYLVDGSRYKERAYPAVRGGLVVVTYRFGSPFGDVGWILWHKTWCDPVPRTARNAVEPVRAMC